MKNRRKLFWSVIAISIVSIVHHMLIWQFTLWERGSDWSELLTHWDSAWYNRIISTGYTGKSWAFFPLYPLSVYSFSRYFVGIEAQIIGSVFSGFLFLVFTVFIAKLLRDKREHELLPKNLLSWFLLVYSASSFVLHTHHTESLFLILSFVAFWNAYEERWFVAAVLAGLCWLTRQQGAFVSLCVALLCARSFYNKGEKQKALKKFLLCAGISTSLFLLYPLYQYVKMGNPLLFIEVQKGWSHATGWGSILRTLWVGNHEQQKFGLPRNLFHHLYYAILWIPVYFLWKRNRILALYGALSLGVLFMQASLLNIYRFGVVLFPLHFMLGEKLNSANIYFKWTVVVLVVALNHYVTTCYGVIRWAY